MPLALAPVTAKLVLSSVTAARLLTASPLALAPRVLTRELRADRLAPEPLANRPWALSPRVLMVTSYSSMAAPPMRARAPTAPLPAVSMVTRVALMVAELPYSRDRYRP